MKFKLFSFLKVKVGKRERTFQLSKNATLEQAVDLLIEKTGVSSEDILEKGKLRRNLVVLINGKAVHDLNRKLSPGDTISLLPSIGGGKGISLTKRDLNRYKRQIILNGFGKEGQRKFKSSRATIVGVGGLGSPLAIYLSVAGLGNIWLIDNDKVEYNNLNRQILHWEKDVGRPKVRSAKEKLEKINNDITVEEKKMLLTSENVADLLQGSDIVLDALDNFKTRFIVNQFCVNHEIPFIHAAVYGLEGRLTTVIPTKGPCLRCLIPENPPEKKKFPILGATAGAIASLEVIEAVKVICDLGTPLVNRMLFFDGQNSCFHVVQVKKDPEWPVCGTSGTE